MLERMRAGRFKSRNTLDDALTVAIVETGVSGAGVRRRPRPGRARDARLAAEAERSAGTGSSCPTGTIVIADERDAVGARVRRHRSRARGVARDARGWCSARSRSRASPTSASRKRCGFAATS